MFRVVLVEPQSPGNVGSVARAMANFGVERLELVNPCRLDPQTNMMARRAMPIVERANRCDTLDEALDGVGLAAAFTSVTAEKWRDHTRTGLSLRSFRRRIDDVQGDVALVFGREDNGLDNAEVEACDALVQVPTSPGYASMNLSHAVAVVLYELAARDEWGPMRPRLAGHEEVDQLVSTVEHMMRVFEFPVHRAEATALAVRRLAGRAPITTWEYHRLMGVLSSACKRLDAWPVEEE